MKNKLIFLPGAWANELVFAPQIAAFKEHYQIVVPDLSKFTSVSDMAKHVIDQHQDVQCIMGLSLGGYVALQILTDYPHYTSKAILMGTHAHAIDENLKQMFLSLIEQVQQGKLAELCQMYAEVVTSEAGHQNKQLIEAIKKIPLAVGAQGCINHHKACLSYEDKVAKLKNIMAKTLIVCSSADKATPVDFHTVLHKNIPNSEIAVLAKGGHFLTLENPEEVNRLIKEWLDRK